MKYLKIFYDWPETTQYLKPAQKGELIDALVRYARGETDVESSLKGAALALFPSFKRQIDSDADAYASQTERNRENGKKGGRPRKETQEKPENPLGFSETQEKPRQRIKTKNKDKEKDKDTDTSEATLPSYLHFLKKIDDNYKHSNRARAAAAQLIVDQIVQDKLLPAKDDRLFDQIVCGLRNGLTPLQIYQCAEASTFITEYIPLMTHLKKIKGEEWYDYE